MSELKAIETIYNGYRFRSRLEARWAVFFDVLGIKYEYEKEGFDLDGVWYLPDFWLPEYNFIIEIKGDAPTHEDWIKFERLVFATNKKVFLFFGGIPYLKKEISLDGKWTYYNLEPNNGSAYIWGDEHYYWCECNVCGMLGIEFTGFADRLPCKHYDGRSSNYDSPRLIAAYTAARQARFEHGEKP